MGSGDELSSFVFDTENRAGSITGDFFRGTAFHAVYQPLVSVTAHDDQIACFLFGGIDDFLNNIPLPHFKFTGYFFLKTLPELL